MASAPPDPYAVLGVSRGASEAEIRVAYRRAVQREHPDHNRGSPESARRFEAVQEAYALIRVQRERADVRREQTTSEPADQTHSGAGSASHPDVEARLADLERELAAARGARERARRAAREAEAQARAAPNPESKRPSRPSDEDLGYIRTDDSFSKIISDAASELFDEAREHRVPQRLSDLIDELGSKLTGD
jgi:curved DNA-binding protein CbpA